jgi:hypothetical protein
MKTSKLAIMHTASAFRIIMFVVGISSQALAFGYIAPEKMELGVSECAGPNLNTFRCARGIERKELAGTRKAIERSDGTLQIRTAKKVVTLVDNPEESGDSAIAYSYLGFSRELNSHVLHVQYYEGDTYMIIHHQSGNHAFPSGFPIVSPDGKYFLSLSEDMFAGYNPNNVEVWSVIRGGFHRIADFNPEWGPHHGNWASPRRALVRKRCYDPSDNNPAGLKSCGVAKIERSGGAWKLVE